MIWSVKLLVILLGKPKEDLLREIPKKLMHGTFNKTKSRRWHYAFEYKKQPQGILLEKI